MWNTARKATNWPKKCGKIPLKVSKISPAVGLFDENYKARLAGGGGDKNCHSKNDILDLS